MNKLTKDDGWRFDPDVTFSKSEWRKRKESDENRDVVIMIAVVYLLLLAILAKGYGI